MGQLDISYNFRMENVCPHIFSAAVVRLSSVNLKMCRLYPVHITKMIESAVSGNGANTQLRDVNLSDNLVCLIDDSQNQNLAVFVSQLRSANFSFFRLKSANSTFFKLKYANLTFFHTIMRQFEILHDTELPIFTFPRQNLPI